MEFSDEQIEHAFDSAPKVIQESLTDGMVIEFLLKMPKRYKLHVDVSGKVIGAVRNMILGLLPPSEFIGTLTNIGIDEETAQKITAELNQEVFIPLRNAVRSSAPERPKVVPITRPAAVISIPPKITAPPAPQSLPHDNTPKQEAPPISLLQKEVGAGVQNIQKQEPPLTLIQPARASIQGAMLHSMASDMARIKEGGVYQPAPTAISHILEPEHATPARSFQTASIPVQVTAAVQEQTATAQMPPLATAPSTAAQPQKIISYAADPYREAF